MSFEDIPDPAAAVVSRTVPELPVPADPSLTRPQRQRRMVVGFVIALGWILVLTLRSGLRADIGALGVAIQLTLWALTAGLALAFVLRSTARGLPAGLASVQVLLVGLIGIFVGTALAWSVNAAPVGDDTSRLGWACFALAAAAGVIPLLIACYLLRRSFLSAPGWRLAIVGAVAGLAGAAGCSAHCPVEAFGHVVLAHGLPIIIGAAVGAAFGARRGGI